MAYPRPTEPDRFLPWQKTTAPIGGVMTAANWAKLRACFVAAGLHSQWADRAGRWIERAGGTLTWNLTTPDTQANQLKNWGYALTKIGVHKDKASAIVRTFPLFADGLGGPVITGLTVPASFKAPV
jgi:hypothetical protein